MTPEEREMLLEMPAVQELLREEREACAVIGDCWAVVYDGDGEIVGRQIAAAIRGRSHP